MGIFAGKRGVTPDTALRLARAFGSTPDSWLNLQQLYDLRVAETTAKGIKAIRPMLPAKKPTAAE